MTNKLEHSSTVKLQYYIRIDIVKGLLKVYGRVVLVPQEQGDFEIKGLKWLDPDKVRSSLIVKLGLSQKEVQALSRADHARRAESKPEAETNPHASTLAASGTGFIASSQGHIVTNHHVVDGCTTLISKTGQGNQTVNLLAQDVGNDLALLGLLTSQAPLLALGAGVLSESWG